MKVWQSSPILLVLRHVISSQIVESEPVFSVQGWLPENHLARFIVEVIDCLDLSELTRQYAGRGSAAHHPAVLLGLLIYGYSTGFPSSRKIERATYDSVAFRYIAT
jgi:transposase